MSHFSVLFQIAILLLLTSQITRNSSSSQLLGATTSITVMRIQGKGSDPLHKKNYSIGNPLKYVPVHIINKINLHHLCFCRENLNLSRKKFLKVVVSLTSIQKVHFFSSKRCLASPSKKLYNSRT
jgi:hypothetical protein